MWYAIYALVYCHGRAAASAEDSRQASDAQHVHRELSLPTGFFALGFSSQYSVWLKKKRGENILLNALSFWLSA